MANLSAPLTVTSTMVFQIVFLKDVFEARYA